jgi:TP901 family phage tail tape measure protein
LGLAETAELAVRISLDDRMTPALGRVNRNLQGFQARTGQVAQGLGKMSSGLYLAGKRITVGLGAAMVGMVAEAARFENAMDGVTKTVGEQEVATYKIAEAFRKMSTEMPIAADELARIGEVAGAIGVKGKDIAVFSETVAKLSKVTKLSSDEAAEHFGKIGTILKLTGDDYEHLGDILVKLGNAGASSEAEILTITRRFAAAGRAANMSTEEILALSSAAASFGSLPEAAGGALSRMFNSMANNIGRGNKEAEKFAKAIGITVGEAKTRLNRGDSLPMMMEFLKSLKGMNESQMGKALYDAGFRNVRDLQVIQGFMGNMKEVRRQLALTADVEGELERVAARRWDNVSTQATIAWNNIKEQARNFGTEVLPAVNRKLKEFIKFLQRPEVTAQMKEWGEKARDFIDSIDLQEVLKGIESFVAMMKPAVGMVEKLAKAFADLPTEIKGGIIGAIGLNTLSGGLIGRGIGDIISGLITSSIRTGIASIPGLGRLAAMPVYVVNMGPGGMGGPGGGGGKGGGARSFLAAGLAGIATAIAFELWQEKERLSRENEERGKVLVGQANEFGANSSLSANQQALANLEAYMADLNSSLTPEAIAYQLNIDGVRDRLAEIRDVLKASAFYKEGVTGERGVAFRESERASGLEGKEFNRGVTRLQSRINAAIRQEARATRRGEDRNARQAQRKIDRLRERLAHRLGEVKSTTKNEGNQSQRAVRATGRDIRSVRRAVDNKKLTVHVSNPISVATYIGKTAISTRYGGNFSVTAN